MNEDTLSSRKGAALRYIAANPPGQGLERIRLKLLPTIPAEFTDRFNEFVRSLGEDENMTIGIIDALVNHFTTQEINAWTDFYLSPSGKSVMEKLPDYSMEVALLVQGKINKLIDGVMSDMGQL